MAAEAASRGASMGSEGETSEERQRRRTEAERQAIVAEAFEVGQSVSAVAERHGISCASIYLWRRQARDGAGGAARKAQGRSHPPSPVTLVPVQIAAPAELAAAHTGRIEIALANGRIVRVGDGIDPKRLARLVAALEGTAPIEGAS
jgi:transposase-like protein